MRSKRVTKRELAAFLGITRKTLSGKLCGETEFTLWEMERIGVFFPGFTLDHLFAHHDVPKSA